jgi:RNA polymerase sigma-70 factor (ECF subfamily)
MTKPLPIRPRPARLLPAAPDGTPATIPPVHALTNTFSLVARAKAGDEVAKNKLFERYYDKVRRVVRVRIGPKLRPHVDTGDALQVTFLKAFQVFHQFEMREEGSFIKWLATIAEGQINDARDRLLAKKRDVYRDVPLDASAPNGNGGGAGDGGAKAYDPAASTRADPAAAAREREEHERLERALDQLPAAARELILARDFEGFSWEQTAKETGCPSADAARMRYATALRDLAVLLAGDTERA